DETVEPANRVQAAFRHIVATQDWHPRGHGSLVSNHPGRKPYEVVKLGGLDQILWPDHCVQGTHGAEFVPVLDTTRIDRVFRKGTDPEIDSYSGFFDNARRKSTGLADYLREQGVGRIYIAGLAEDFCVLYTTLDARRLGFDTFLIHDATRGVDVNPGDIDR